MEERNETISRDRAIAMLTIYYGIDEPTEQQIAMYMLYGSDADYCNGEMSDERDLLRV